MDRPRINVAKAALDISPQSKSSGYPEPFFSLMGARSKRKLGEAFGLRNFGVNLTELHPGGQSALLHTHTKQDEFIYILQGTPTLIMEDGQQVLTPGMCVGFPAGGTGHHLINRSQTTVVYIEIGDRTPGDEGKYPEDDLRAQMVEGRYVFTHKDGSPYD